MRIASHQNGLFHGESPFRVGGKLREYGEFAGQFAGGIVADRSPVKTDGVAGGKFAVHMAQQGRFSRSVRPDDTEAGAGRYGEIDIGEQFGLPDLIV